MSVFPEIRIKKSPLKYDWFELIEECKFGEIVIPAGFTSDGASMLRIFWPIIPPHGLAFNASVLHDFLYENFDNRADRKYVDDMFLANLLASDVPIIQSYVMYFYVRLLGWWTWREFTQENHS
jgi:hypothetical protein